MLEPDADQPLWHSILKLEGEGLKQVLVFNPTVCSCSVGPGTKIGEATPVTLVQPDHPTAETQPDGQP